MGFDVTYHPIKREEFKFYIEEVVKQPDSYQKQLTCLHSDANEQAFLNDGIYSRFGTFKSDVLAGTGSFDKTIGFATAAIASYLHPYWYARGGLLSRLVAESGFQELNEPWSIWVDEELRPVFDQAVSLVSENYSSGCLIPYDKLEKLKQTLQVPENQAVVEKLIGDEDNRKALYNCIQYCLEQQTALLEATDLFVPFSGEHYSFAKNFKAFHLKNLDDFTNHSESKPLS